MPQTIRSIVDWISNNRITSALPPILAVAGWALKWLRDKRDSDRIYRFLVQSTAKTGWRFRSDRSHLVCYSPTEEACREVVHPRQADQEKRKRERVLATRLILHQPLGPFGWMSRTVASVIVVAGACVKKESPHPTLCH